MGLTRNLPRGRPKTQKCPQRKIPVSRIQRFQRPMTQSQEIDGLAEFNQTRLSCDKKSRFLFTFPWLSEEIPISPIQRFQPPMTQSQEIDGLAEFDLKLDPKYRAGAWPWDDAGFVGRLLDFVGCSPGPALESAQLHVHRQPRKRKKSKAVHMRRSSILMMNERNMRTITRFSFRGFFRRSRCGPADG